jgi:TetR/AcrR family transcriptional repressor of nem operon
VARPREFDERAVVDTAIQVFTERGYAGTGANDICERAGISRSSLYNSFGTRDALFERALTEYTEAGRAEIAKLLASTDPAPVVLRRRIAEAIGAQCSRDDRAGCLSVNTAVELGRSMDAVAAILDADRARWLAAYTVVIERGQREGDLRPELDAAGLAALVHTTMAGLRVAARVATPAELERQIDVLLATMTTTRTTTTTTTTRTTSTEAERG